MGQVVDSSRRFTSSLAEVARAVAGASDLQAQMGRVAEAVCAAVDADAAFVERVIAPLEEVEVVAGSGSPVPPLGTRTPYPGSLAEEVIESGDPELLDEAGVLERLRHGASAEGCAGCSALILPLLSERQAVGALVLLRTRGHPRFLPDDARRLRPLADMAAVALRRELDLEGLHHRARALEESEARFGLFVGSVRDYGIFMLDTSGRVTSWNAGAERITGYHAREIIGRHFSAFYSEADRTRGHPQAELEIAARDGVYQEEGWRLRRDGNRFWAHVTITAVRDEGGELIGFGKVTRDLSERRELEEALRIDALRYRTIYDDNPSIYLTADAALRITSTNRFGAAYLGYAPGELSGRDLLELVEPDDRTAVEAHLLRCLADPEQLFMLEFRKRRRDGTVLWVREAARAVRDERGELSVLTACEDVTERRQAAEMQHFLVEAGRVLASSLEYEETLCNVAELAVQRLADWCVVDLVEGDEIHRVAVAHADSGRTGFVEEYQARFPPDPQARIGGPAVIRSGEPELLTDISDEHLRAAARSEEQHGMLAALGFRSAMAVPLRVGQRVVGALTFVSGRPERQYGPAELAVAEVLAEQAALAIEKARLYRESREASRLRDEVLSVVSHDLRNPLNTIFMSSSFLCDTLPPDGQESTLRQVQIIRRAADQMNRLIQDLLDVAQIEAGRLPIEPFPASAAALVEEARESFGPLAESRGIRLEVEAPGELPRVCADRDRVLQVFSNLIGNAVKFTPEGGKIRVSAREEGARVRFLVRDTGEGIAPEEIPYLFNRFYQVRAARRGGAGLGLSIARGIVEGHGGRIWVESTPGEGSTFCFTLPVDGERGRQKVEHAV
jgi:PAS domain S-box-containing protein